MKKRKAKIVLLENKHQVNCFFKKINDFDGFIPISFSFEVEKILEKEKKNYVMEENYEDNKIYLGIHPASINATSRICARFKLDYRGVDLFRAFYYNIYLLVSSSKKYSRLIKKIISKERPDEIVSFENQEFSYNDEEYFRFILKSLFKGKLIAENYSISKKSGIRDKNLVKMAGILQKLYAKLNIFLSRKSSNNIFVYGGKTYFESVCRELSGNKNKIFNFDGFLRKSFSIKNRYIPFYEFSGISNKNQDILKEKICTLKSQIFGLDFTKEFGTEREIEGILKNKIISLIDREFIKIAGQIEEFYKIIKKGKISLILSSADSIPFSYSIVSLAKYFRIPTVVAQHGFFNHEIGYRTASDYVLASGKKIKQEYLHYGADKEGVRAVGCSRYDNFIPKKHDKSKNNIIFYGMEVANGNEMVADTHLSKKRQKEILKILFNVLKKYPQYKLIIKTRLNWELAKLPREIAEKEGFTNFEVIEKGDNTKLINDSDLVIVNRSTLGIEAMLLNKPIVSVYYKDLDLYNPFCKLNFVKKVYNSKQLNTVISELDKISKEDIDKIRKKLNDYFITDRKSTERSVDLIESVLKNQNHAKEHKIK
ncbi:MAG: hypothetical protein AABW50_00490 [Nanoarchaeota archaeon]